ncbi:uncharacterized protein LOC143237661 isoform X2 [Tachypleus tridentatus]|uniref:uncharacterized protein LOC143237661 isoform X2 n=1 Tax=Tachypleus tridentatus TaxID=6853 RepID=UPI003FCFEA25
MEYSEFPLGSYIDEIASLDKASTHSEENECFTGFGKQTEHSLPSGSAQKKANLLKKDERLFDFPETLFTCVSNEEDIAYDSRTSDIQHFDCENLSNISGLLEFLNNTTERDENGEMCGNMKRIACPLMQNKSFILHHLGYNPLCIQEYREQDDKCFTLDSTSSFDSQGSLEGKNNGSSNRDSIISLASSLGILNTSQMSSISLEGMADGNTSRDSIDLLNELEELSFQNKKLQAENGRLKMQISQTEETTSQLMNDNDELKLKLNSFQIMLDKSKYLEREHDEIKAILEQGENTKLELEKNIANLQKENSHLTSQIKDLEQELMMTYATVENYMKEGELTTILKDKIEEVTHQKNLCKTELDEKTTLYEELKQMVKEYAKTTEILQQEKNVLEVQLYKAQEEVQSIVEAVGINYYWNVENVDDELDSCDTEDIVDDIPAHYNASLTKSLKSQKIISRFFEKQPFYSSTPFRQQVLKSPSICAEIKDLICENDSLPTPICGKEIHFLSCNEGAASPLPCLTFPDKRLTLQEQLMNTSSVYHEGPQSRNIEQEEKVSLERVMFLYPDAEDSKANLPEDQIHIKPELKQNRDDKIRYENNQEFTEILLKEVLHVKKILKSLQVEAVRFLGVYQAYPLEKEQASLELLL